MEGQDDLHQCGGEIAPKEDQRKKEIFSGETSARSLQDQEGDRFRLLPGSLEAGDKGFREKTDPGDALIFTP